MLLVLLAQACSGSTNTTMTDNASCWLQASAEVDVMTQDLKEAQIVVGVATNECNSLLETIASSTGEVETKQTTARSKEQQLQVCRSSKPSAFLQAKC